MFSTGHFTPRPKIVNQRNHEQRQHRRGEGAEDQRHGQPAKHRIENHDEGAEDNGKRRQQNRAHARGAGLDYGFAQFVAFAPEVEDEVDEQ